jgi:hypothetical protein
VRRPFGLACSRLLLDCPFLALTSPRCLLGSEAHLEIHAGQVLFSRTHAVGPCFVLKVDLTTQGDGMFTAKWRLVSTSTFDTQLTGALRAGCGQVNTTGDE